MPFHLQEFLGGLGNQIFSVCTLYALAKKYNTTFSLPVSQQPIRGMNGLQIPIYVNSVLKSFLQDTLYLTTVEPFSPNFHIQLRQFESVPRLDSIDCKQNSILCSGLPMKYSEFEDSLLDIQEKLYSEKNKVSPLRVPHTSTVRKVGVMFRTFLPEGRMEWMVVPEYYEEALKTIVQNTPNDTYEFHIYTDVPDVAQSILESFLSSYKLQYTILEHIGVRDNKTDVEHFFQMFDLDDYILCNSTYHYWPALLSNYCPTKRVTYPTRTRDGQSIDWFSHIVPSSWTRISL